MNSTLTIILAVVIAIIIIIILLTGYVKAPPDRAYIISGIKKQPKFVIGKSSIKIPYLERKDELDLSLIQVDIKTETAVPTREFINVRVDGVANVKVSNDDESLRNAAENFLNKSKEYIAGIAQQVLEGNMREIIGTMSLTELVHNRDSFAQNVQESTTQELRNMGLSVINLTIQNFVDDNNVIENLGIDNVTKIQKDAAIARANSERDIKIAQSLANSEANEAEMRSQTQISIRENELEIKRADLKAIADSQQAKSDASYSIAQQIERKQIEIETINADIARTEKESERVARQVEVQEKSLRVEVEKVADAQRYKKQQEADAEMYRRMKDAEAQAFEVERQAQAELKRAEAIRQVGQAEADVLERKADAQNRYNEAALAMKLVENLPEVVRAAAEPLSKTEKIVMFGEGNAERMIQDTLHSSLGVVEGLKEGTGIDLQSLLAGFLGGSVANRAYTSETAITSPESKDIVAVDQPDVEEASIEPPVVDHSQESSLVDDVKDKLDEKVSGIKEDANDIIDKKLEEYRKSNKSK